MKDLIPPHIAWPLGIIALLLLSVGGSLSALYFAGSDGGAQIVDGYYEKAANWDAHMQQEADNTRLGWTVDLNLKSENSATRTYVVDVSARDRTGEPLDDLIVRIRTSRPQHSGYVSEAVLVPVQESAGLYRYELVFEQAGLWDFEVFLENDSDRFIKTVRKEL